MSASGATVKPTRAYVNANCERDLKDVVLKLQRAVNASRSDMVNEYDKVSVLAVQWENDNIGVAALTTRLMKAFRTKYKFRTRIYTIPVYAQQGRVTGL